MALYNYFRDYDPSIGRYIQADPRGLKDHVEKMFYGLRISKILHNAGIPFSSSQPLPPEPNPYAYTSSNPLSWTDPTGEGIGAPGAAIVIGGACFALYCSIRAINVCQVAYPPHLSDPMQTRKMMQCAVENTKFCMTLGTYLMDPIGEAAKEIGGHIGEQLNKCDGCGNK